MKKIYVLGGGTVFHLRPHFALSAPAYGKTAIKLAQELEETMNTTGRAGVAGYEIHLGLTKMAIGGMMERRNYQRTHMIGETNAEVDAFLEKIVADPDTKMIFMSVALCDFEGCVGHQDNEYQFRRTATGKNEPRLKSRDDNNLYVELRASDKLIGKIRKQRKDIFLVGFKTTASAPEEQQYEAGLTLLKQNSCNLVLANDVQTGLNMIICPELAQYSVTHDRTQVLHSLIEMSLLRSSNEFTRTEINQTGHLISWTQDPAVPETLRKVVDWCIEKGAYKPFKNITTGHFGVRLTKPGAEKAILLSSRRKQNFNLPECRDLVSVHFDGRSQVAFGAKPSAGARSQYIVLSKFDDLDCIVHFHSPKKHHSMVPSRSQREFECGSHQCGKNTADGMARVNQDLAVVMLDKHGPNIVFSSKADPQMVIDFIEANFDLSKQTR